MTVAKARDAVKQLESEKKEMKTKYDMRIADLKSQLNSFVDMSVSRHAEIRTLQEALRRMNDHEDEEPASDDSKASRENSESRDRENKRDRRHRKKKRRRNGDDGCRKRKRRRCRSP